VSALLSKIRLRGYWHVVIRPCRFVPKRVPEISVLPALLRKSSIQLLGWAFPHIALRPPLHIDNDWIGQEFERQDNLETWRFYQSGQFAYFCGMQYDWRDQLDWDPPGKDWKPGSLLDIDETLVQFTAAFELAARLALTEVGDERMYVQITGHSLQGRVLGLEIRQGARMGQYRAGIEEFGNPVELYRSELIAEPREYALKSARDLFQRFGWNPPLELLRSQQAEF